MPWGAFGSLPLRYGAYGALVPAIVSLIVFSTPMPGRAQDGTGGDGCFFGECPEDRPTVTRRPPRVPPEPIPDFDIPPQPVSPPAVAQMCLTQLGNCWMGMPIPVGSSCYCPSGFGPVWGVAQ